MARHRASRPNQQTETAEVTHPKRRVRAAAAVTALLAAGATGGVLLNRSGESAGEAYSSAETAAPALATDILDLYRGDSKVTPSIESAGDDGSEIIKARYQVPGPTEAAGYAVDSTEYSLYVQVPNAEEALADKELTADEIISVNVQAAHVHGYDYAPAPFAYSATLSNENGAWMIDASGTDNGAEWRVHGIPETPALQQMHQAIEKAAAGEPLPGMPRPE